MKSFTNLLSSLIMAMSLVAIAIFSIQNVDNVSVKFLTLESITIPIGILLVFCSGIGLILGWLIPLLFSGKRVRRS